jgi:hypothetical protein
MARKLHDDKGQSQLKKDIQSENAAEGVVVALLHGTQEPGHAIDPHRPGKEIPETGQEHIGDSPVNTEAFGEIG